MYYIFVYRCLVLNQIMLLVPDEIPVYKFSLADNLNIRIRSIQINHSLRVARGRPLWTRYSETNYNPKNTVARHVHNMYDLIQTCEKPGYVNQLQLGL